MQLEKNARRDLAELTSAVVSACCATRKMSPSELLALMSAVGAALRKTGPAPQAPPPPARHHSARPTHAVPMAANDNVDSMPRKRGLVITQLRRPMVPVRMPRARAKRPRP
jgi:predicted transcriptional regulator